MKKKSRNIIKIFLLLLILADIAFSFNQFYHMKLDGDIAPVVVPSKDYSKVLEHPLGIPILKDSTSYPAPNRYVPHKLMSGYFKTVPFLIQEFTTPIESVYLSAALAKTIIQVLLIFLLASYISGTSSIFSLNFLISASLIFPLFQAFGYNIQIGIIDKSVTYSFFYALSLVFLLLFYLPFFRSTFYKKPNLNTRWLIVLFILSFFLAFNGPLIPAITLIISPLYIIFLWRQKYVSFRSHMSFSNALISGIKKTASPAVLLLIFVSALSLYSIYIGSFNTENHWSNIPLIERYFRLPKGLFMIFSRKPGPGLFLLVIAINTILLYKHKGKPDRKKILDLLKWIGIFAVIYLLLLPLGGFREYRPFIIRRDTFLPVLLLMIIFYGISSRFLIQNMKKKWSRIYVAFIVLFLITFINADKKIKHQNRCEYEALEVIANSPKRIVPVEKECNVLSWQKIYDYKKSSLNGDLLKLWNITDTKKYYYNPKGGQDTP